MGTSSEVTSGIKVLDRAVTILRAVADHPLSLADMTARTSLPRATAHRLATAMEVHDLLTRTPEGRWGIGPTIMALAPHSADSLIDAASPIMTGLMEKTAESVQLYRLTGNNRTCIASLEPPSGLQNTVPIGSRMELTAGSAAKIFLAWGSDELKKHIMPHATYTEEDLAEIRARGWAESVAEREQGLASLSAPVFQGDMLIAALSVSGPEQRLAPSPGAKWGLELLTASTRLSHILNQKS